VAGALAKVCEQLLLAANDSDAMNWLPGVPIVRDRYVDAGGLAGVDAALAWASTRDSTFGGALVVAWDMPFVSASLLGELLRVARTSEAEVVVPESVSPYGFEPFCAYYSAQLAEPLSGYLRDGSGAGPARDFIAQVKSERVALDGLRRFGDPAVLLASVNTDADLARAERLARAGL
jgi:molybdopterin-guanine dinucleotide biosynthesis protein A